MSTATLTVVGPGPTALADPRLVAWRDAFVTGATETLRRWHTAWDQPGLDASARAVAAVGVLDPEVRGPVPRLPGAGAFADVAASTGLDVGSEAVLALVWWAAVDPQVASVWACLHDDATRRAPSLGALATVLATVGVRSPLAIDETHPLARRGLLAPVADPAAPLRLPATTAAVLAAEQPEVPDPGEVPPRVAGTAGEIAALVTAGVRVLARCVVLDDREVLRDAVAARLALAVAPAPRPAPVADLLLRLGRELPAQVLEPGDPLEAGTVLALAGAEVPGPSGWHVVDLAAPGHDEAGRLWLAALRRHGIRATAADVADLTARTLSERTVEALAARAVSVAAALGRRATTADVAAAVRAHPRRDPGGLARPVPTSVTLDDLVLGGATREALDEVLAHARTSAAAHDRLGLTGRRGRGVIALFHGPSGTGKTAAAEAVAAALDRDLWVVDLAQVVSKWLGETQQHLDTVLRDAAAADAVLLFDEADGLFGKRGEVTDARDRYANLEIDHLLQRVETHDGVVVLTSNRPAALDEAFARRIRLAVRFEPPDHAGRVVLWRRHLPDVDIEEVAREALSGGTIRAAALAATVTALDRGESVTPEGLRTAVHRELEKNRRPPTARGSR
jgi:hypothetical protein